MADAVMAGEDFAPLAAAPLAGLRFGVVQGFPLENLEATVGRAFAAATKRLEQAGVRVTHETISLLDDMRHVNAYGGIVQPEACAIHRDRLKRRAADIDPNVRVRIERGCAMSAADYIGMLYARERLVRAMDGWLAGFDALIMPTAGIVAPTIAEVDGPGGLCGAQFACGAAQRAQSVNFFDLCGDLAAAAGAASGRADAVGAQRPRPCAPAHGRRRGGVVCRLGKGPIRMRHRSCQ